MLRIAWLGVLVAAIVGCGGEEAHPPTSAGPEVPWYEDLPAGCVVTKSEEITGDQLEAIGGRLGAPLKSLSNTYLLVHGKPIQVNVLEASTEAEAAAVFETISAMKTDPAFCLLVGRRVIEFVGADVATAIKTTYEVGFVEKPTQVRYRITAHASTIETADYMAFNELFNVFLATDTASPSAEAVARIEELSEGFTFGRSLVLRAQGSAGGASAYRFTPEPTVAEDLPNGRVVYSFDQPPEVLGVPYVTMTATITCNAAGLTPATRGGDASLLSATPHWPVDDPDVVAQAATITAGRDTPQEKVQAILEWLGPGTNIDYGGVTGSRWGVKKVLSQEYGHCWDFSDCFVTLARAAGIPSRQVGGWLYGVSGHIWAEVLIEGAGWQQVDPTGGGRLDCGIYHIPYFTTETGDMPILYLSMPQIEILDTR